MTTLNDLLNDESSFEINEENARNFANSINYAMREQYATKKGREELCKLVIILPFVYAALC